MLTPEQSAAFLMSQSVACLAEISGMNAINDLCRIKGEHPVHLEAKFDAVLSRYLLREDIAQYILVHGEIPTVERG